MRDRLWSGRNEIGIEGIPVDGPSAVAARLHLDLGEGRTHAILTDSEWIGREVVSKGPVSPARWGLNVLPEVSASAEYNQWKEALEDGSAHTVSPLPDGFVLERLRDAEEDEDSWVSLAIDPEGRLVIGKEKAGLLRLTFSDNGSEVVSAEHLAEELRECRGLVFRGDTLFANANSSKTLYRLRDTTGDDLYDEIVEMQRTEGGGGHGRNDLALKLSPPVPTVHSIQGDSVEAPDHTIIHTAPEPGDPKPLGYWSSLGENDSEWHLYNRGLRNPYGIDFNHDGEAFTYDADNEGDVGLPFYRPSRISHLVVGANYGYHQRPGNTRSIPVYAPDSVPTTFDVGRGSPTSVKFGYRSDFPEPWRSGLFALDWAYGRIIRVDLVPRGASYYASGETFVEGRPLNVTDLDFDESGAMLFVTGGRKTKSALYRLRYEGAVVPLPIPSRQAIDRSRYSSEARLLRRSLSGSLRMGSYSPDSPALAMLGSPDPWLRDAARVHLERRSVEEWGARALRLEGDSPLAHLTTLLALVRQGAAADRAEALAVAASFPPDGWRRAEKLTLLRIGELGLVPETPEAVRNRLAERALGWIGSPGAPVTRESIRLLSLLDHPETVATARHLLDLSETQEDRLFLLEMLSTVRSGWTYETRAAYFKDLAVARRTSAGDRFMPPFFDAIETAALAAAPESDREKLEDLLFASATEEAMPEPRPFVRNWEMDDFPGEDFEGMAVVDDETGRELFRAGLCHRCHTFGAEGYPVGPDLARVGSRFAPRDLLQSILEPSAVVSEVYRNLTVELDDGTSVTGRLLRDDFRESTLHLSTDPFDPTKLTPVSKERIVRLTESEISPMPPSLVSSFEKEEVLTLVQWLVQGPKVRGK